MSGVEALPKLLEDVVGALVNTQTDIRVVATSINDVLLLEVRVNEMDFGKLLGKEGAHVEALRLLFRSMGRKCGHEVLLRVQAPHRKSNGGLHHG